MNNIIKLTNLDAKELEKYLSNYQKTQCQMSFK